jgi:hypothetical protein
VFFNFSDNAQLEAWKMFRYYHEADPIRQKVETQFRDLDSLIQRVDAGLQEEEFRRLLERYDPSGPPN